MRRNIDAGHSIIEFGVEHLGMSTVKGRFKSFEGSVETGPAEVPTRLDVAIEAAVRDLDVELVAQVAAVAA